ncbi:MAG: hypothetical protein QM784_05165 [Polyangiaceae bacterium]
MSEASRVSVSVAAERDIYEHCCKKVVFGANARTAAKTADLLSDGRRDKVRRVRKVRTFCSVFGVLALLVTEVAGAQSPATANLSLQQRGMEACMSAQSMATAVEQRLKRSVFVERSGADLLVEIRIVESADHVDVDIALSSGTGVSLGHRSLTSPKGDCNKLNDSLSLVLALMVDLNREEVQHRTTEASDELQKSVAVDANTNSNPKVAQSTTTTTTSSAPPHQPERWVLSLGGNSVLGSVPGLGFALRGAIGRHHSRLSEELGAAVVSPTTRNDGANSKAEFAQYLLDANLCAAPFLLSSVVLRACGGLEFGVTRAEGFGYLRERTALLPNMAPLVRADSTWWPTPRFGLRLGLGAKAAFFRDAFFVVREDGSEHELFRPAFGALFLQADVCVKL